MWGQDWGTMIWGGNASAVPVLSPLGLLTLTALLVAMLWGVHQRRLTRSAALLALLVAIAVPLVAMAAVSLPHIFINGTVADADEVNENFDTIVEDFARYHLVLTGASAGNSTPIPDAVITQLCRDDDGCTYSVLSKDRNAVGDFPVAFKRAGFWVNSVNGRWIEKGDGQSGTDANGIPEDLTFSGDCRVSDGEYVGFTGTDSVAGFNFVVWSGPTNPNRECHLTITD